MDFIAILTIIVLVVSGGLLFFGVPITIYLLKDKISWWPRQKWRIMIYEAEIRDVAVGEMPLLDADGKPTYDTQGRPVMNKIYEKKIHIPNETPILDGWCWKIKKKIIPWLRVDRGWLKGFELDLTYLAYAAPTGEKGEKVIRVAQLSKGVWEGGSFYPLGEPDITMLDKRHAIFTHRIDQATIDQSISAMEQSAWTDFQKNRARKDEDAVMKIIQMLAPVFIVVLVLIVAMFAFDFASKSMDKSIGLVDSHLKTCEAGYAIQTIPQAVNTTTTPSSAIKLPFG